MKNTFGTFLGCLGKELEVLTHSAQIAFGASCCERAYPNYEVFSRLTNWGDKSVLRAALNKAWDSVGNQCSVTGLRQLREKCESLTPDLDDFSSADVDVQAAAAQEAAFMIALLLDLMFNNDPLLDVRIANFARDTIDMYVQVLENLEPSDPNIEEEIEKHPLMVAELAAQRADLAELKRITTREDFAAFKKTRMNVCKSNIGLKTNQFEAT